MPYTDAGLPYQPTDTSEQAAIEAAPRSERERARLLRALQAAGAWGLTDEEMQDLLEMPGNTQRPRRREMEAMLLVTRSGLKRKTRAGRWAIVWIVR